MNILILIVCLLIILYLLMGFVLLVLLAGEDNRLLTNWECLKFLFTWGGLFLHRR